MATTSEPTWAHNLDPNACDTYMELLVIATTVCGDSNPAGEVVYYACESFGFGRFAATPNPTNGDIQIEAISVQSSDTKKPFLKEIQVVDKFGNVKRKIKLGNDIQKTKINISQLPPDVYFIRIYDGKTWHSKKIVKY
jgi:hypothetical protein